MPLDPVALKTLALELNAALPPPPPPTDGFLGLPALLDMSERARSIRRIADIANTRGWQLAVTRMLDSRHACYVSDLCDDDVFALLRQLERYEDCAEACCDPDDCFPAR